MNKKLLTGIALLLTLITLISCFSACTGDKTPDAGTQNETVDPFDPTVIGTNHTTSVKAKQSALYYFNKAYKAGPFAGDPYLFYDDGTFYLYGTTRKYVKPGSIVEKFEVYYSTDLVNWEDGGACFSPARGDWCTSRLWAPDEVFSNASITERPLPSQPEQRKQLRPG